MSVTVAIVLILSGVVVGFINTLSAGGTTISIALFLAMGIDVQSINAVNRIGVLIQNGFGSAMFYKQGYYKLKDILPYSIPVMLGALAGSLTAVNLSERTFSVCLAIVLLIMIVFLFVEKKKTNKQEKPLTLKRFLLFFPAFFGIGFFGGFVQTGTGFLLIAALSLLLGFDLVKTVATRMALMFLYTVIAIIVFFVRGEVELQYWFYGLIHSLGMIFGTWIAGKYALKKGEKMVRIVIVFVIILTALNLFGILDFQQLFSFL